MKRCFLFLVILLTSISTFAQKDKQDVVYLKNGSVIRGEVVNLIPNETVKIKTADGSVFAYSMDEVKEITKEPAITPPKQKKPDQKRKGYIGLSMGAAIPLGDFSNSTFGDTDTGFQINLVTFGYLFSDHLGICAAWTGGSNYINYFSYSTWGYGSLMAGPLLSTHISNKLELDLRPMIGFSSASYPFSEHEPEYTLSFAYSIGTLLRINVGRRIALLVNADFFSTKPNFEYYDIEQKISVFNIGGGIAYRLR